MDHALKNTQKFNFSKFIYSEYEKNKDRKNSGLAKIFFWQLLIVSWGSSRRYFQSQWNGQGFFCIPKGTFETGFVSQTTDKKKISLLE